jgi:hypothetical protein
MKRRPTRARPSASRRRPERPEDCSHRLIVPVDAHERCSCGRTAFEALGGIAREVSSEGCILGWGRGRDGLDPVRPIDCPCGEQMSVIWHELGSSPTLEFVAVADDEDCSLCAAGHPALRLEETP